MSVLASGIIALQHNEGQTGGVPGFDVNVQMVWYQGYTGQGIVVTVLDDGCDYHHPDLIDNYVSHVMLSMETKKEGCDSKMISFCIVKKKNQANKTNVLTTFLSGFAGQYWPQWQK